MENKLETIRQACIKANPAIMELGFGCELDDHEMQERVTFLGKTSVDADMCFIPSICDTCSIDIREDKQTILGRPIRLADVLLAIGHKYINEDDSEGFPFVSVNYAGQFLTETNKIKRQSTRIYWNLIKDDLREQSEETIDFLFNLLK